MLAEQPSSEGDVVEFRRQFEVGRETLFQAWTDADALKAWFGPDGVETRGADIDLRVGGKYRLELHLPSGDIVVHHGAYLEIVPPEKLVFSWILEGQSCGSDNDEPVTTKVTVLFHAVGDHQTELHLVHEGLPTQTSRDNHGFGWKGCFNSLGDYVTTELS
ncbi:MAG: activator of HSP90 ATPase [marine bacterium B5-7]|nr:MAG: activator of HSP90 ATPase [marine bacterium B5-7]